MSDKKRVIFVDDEPNLLAGLRRMLRSMRKEWDMVFAPGGEEALVEVAANPPDVIVSDMRMPGMDGAELLARVMVESPQTVRMVLSGQAERESILRGAAAIHQYLGKPCDADTLKDAVRRSCALTEMMPNVKIRRVVSQLDPFAALSLSLDDVLEKLKEGDSPVSGLSELVSTEMGIDAATVQHIDGALSRLRSHIPSPAQASVLLGLNTLKLLALSAQVYRQYEHRALAEMAIYSMWQHGIAVGQFAAEIARTENAPQAVIDFAAVAGLLHDIGKLILSGYFAADYVSVRELMARENVATHVAEKQILGVTHADVGAYLLALWGLPAPVVDAVKFHDTPPQSMPEFSAALAVYAANGLEYESHVGHGEATSQKIDMAYLKAVGFAEKLSAWRTACLAFSGEGVA